MNIVHLVKTGLPLIPHLGGWKKAWGSRNMRLLSTCLLLTFLCTFLHLGGVGCGKN